VDSGEFVPRTVQLARLRSAVQDCRGCELHADATQAVFGVGPRHAEIMLVGEQPGDQEDRAGEPFIGPAGRLLDQALREAGLDRADLFLTNAVKHFRWKATAGGKRRLHAKPDVRHVGACRPWLTAELRSVTPRAVVALGATAAQTLFGTAFRLTQHRGERLPWPPPDGPYADSDLGVEIAAATIHPSAVLRAGDGRADMLAGLVTDLRAVADAVR
jgi:DNA polymerase